MMMMMTGDRELLHSLMFDAEATRGAMSGWRKENFEDTPRLVEHHALVLFPARALTACYHTVLHSRVGLAVF